MIPTMTITIAHIFRQGVTWGFILILIAVLRLSKFKDAPAGRAQVNMAKPGFGIQLGNLGE
jgi:hypothetical protein